MPRLAHTMRSPAFGGMPASTPTWMGVEAGRTRLNARQIHSCRSKAQSGLTGTTGVVAGCGQGTHARDVVRPRATSCDLVRRRATSQQNTASDLRECPVGPCSVLSGDISKCPCTTRAPTADAGRRDCGAAQFLPAIFAQFAGRTWQKWPQFGRIRTPLTCANATECAVRQAANDCECYCRHRGRTPENAPRARTGAYAISHGLTCPNAVSRDDSRSPGRTRIRRVLHARRIEGPQTAACRVA